MATSLQSYLVPEVVDQQEEFNPAGVSLEDYIAVSQEAQDAQPEVPMSVDNRAQAGVALAQYLQQANRSMADEEAGIGQLQKYLTQYQQKPKGVDLTPLASVFDQLTVKPGDSMEVAKLMRPETEEARTEKIMKLQDLIQQRKGSLTQKQMTALNSALKQKLEADSAANKLVQDQLKMKHQDKINQEKLKYEKTRTDAYLESIKSRERIAAMQAAAQAKRAETTQNKADKRQEAGLADKKEKKVEDQVIKFEQKAIDAVPLVDNLTVVEEILGGPIEQYDPKTETINGKKVDLPGKSIPGVGRVFTPGSQGETLQTAFSNIFNTTLKERSGAAVTDQELNRLKGEFAQGKFNTEAKMVEALQRYKRILKKRMQQHEAAYKPEVREMYRNQGGSLSQDFFPEPGAGKPPPGPERREWEGKTYEKQGDSWVEVN